MLSAVFACVFAAGAADAANGASRASGARFFISTCAFSHEAPDDPIVFPDHPNFSHLHTFVGNVSTNAFSTLASLRKAGTSCNRTADTASYWAPTLYVDGAPLAPDSATIYYRRLTIAPVKPFPPGLRMVAGNSHAVTPQSTSITYWSCSDRKQSFYGPMVRSQAVQHAAGSPELYSSGIPHCTPDSELRYEVNFPDCWNGTSLDSPDHKRHMAYSSSGRCPASNPVPVPAISLVYTYPPGSYSSDAFLSSGGQHSGHADFINSWKQSALRSLVENCLDANRGCGENAEPSGLR
jgi:hypothetical protein